MMRMTTEFCHCRSALDRCSHDYYYYHYYDCRCRSGWPKAPSPLMKNNIVRENLPPEEEHQQQQLNEQKDGGGTACGQPHRSFSPSTWRGRQVLPTPSRDPTRGVPHQRSRQEEATTTTTTTAAAD